MHIASNALLIALSTPGIPKSANSGTTNNGMMMPAQRPAESHQQCETGAPCDRISLANEEGRQPGHESVNERIRYHEGYAPYDQIRQEGTPEQVARSVRHDGLGRRSQVAGGNETRLSF